MMFRLDLNDNENILHCLIPKILSDQIWIASYFGQPWIYPFLLFLALIFLEKCLKS